MKKYTQEVLMKTSNTTMGYGRQIKEYEILADGVRIFEKIIYQFTENDETKACFPIANTVITNVETLT